MIGFSECFHANSRILTPCVPILICRCVAMHPGIFHAASDNSPLACQILYHAPNQGDIHLAMIQTSTMAAILLGREYVE